MERKDIQQFLFKEVAIGTLHYSQQGRLFFYYGLLADIRDNVLVLHLTKGGVREVQLSDIIEIKEDPRRQNMEGMP